MYTRNNINARTANKNGNPVFFDFAICGRNAYNSKVGNEATTSSRAAEVAKTTDRIAAETAINARQSIVKLRFVTPKSDRYENAHKHT